MKTIPKLLSNTITLLLLVALTLAALWFFNRPAPDSQPVAQEPAATPTPIEQIATPTPNSEVPSDEQIEPTWTPVIVLPESSPPPLPTQIPTPTATPVNPDEQELISLNARAFIGPSSPDGQYLAFIAREKSRELDVNPYNQLWKLDLTSRQTTKLVEFGTDPIWSPDSNALAYQTSTFETVEVKSVGATGNNDRSLLKNEDILGYYWLDADRVGLLRPDGIYEVDQSGQIRRNISINVPSKDPANFNARSKVVGHPINVVVTMYNRQLQVTQPSGHIITINAGEGSHIFDFTLSPNGQRIAYLVSNDPVTELWVSNFNGQNKRKLFDLEYRHMRLMAWSPDSQVVVIGWAYTGTNITGGLTPVWINVLNGQVISLGVDEVNAGLTFSADGKTLFYGRSTFLDDYGSEQSQDKTTFYQLEVQ